MKNSKLKIIKTTIRIILLVMALLFLFGCGSTKEITEIKPVVIHPPVIEDSIKATTKSDTVIIGVDVIKNDTVTIVKYFPKIEKFYVKAKPDSITIWDTVKTTQTIEKLIETPLLSKIGLIFIGAIAMLIVSSIIRSKI